MLMCLLLARLFGATLRLDAYACIEQKQEGETHTRCQGAFPTEANIKRCHKYMWKTEFPFCIPLHNFFYIYISPPSNKTHKKHDRLSIASPPLSCSLHPSAYFHIYIFPLASQQHPHKTQNTFHCLLPLFLCPFQHAIFTTHTRNKHQAIN